MKQLKEMSFKDKNAIFGRLEEIVSQANLSQEERAQYEYEWKIYNDYFNTIESAEKKAAAEARAEGLAEEQIKLAKGFKESGVSIATIAQVTGLSIEEIERL